MTALSKLETMTISTPADLAEFWSVLLGDGGFGRRTLWLTVLEESSRPSRVLMPIDDVPRVPHPSDVKHLGVAVASLAETGTVVLLLSRPGQDAVHEDDLRWARALTALAPSWPIHLATADHQGRCRVQPLLSATG